MEKLTWMPVYIDSLLSSPAWNDMKDYQRGWYFQLLLRSTRSERMGYLPLDGSLWRIAGAHSRAMWDSHCAAVMACFKIRQYDGRDWIYNDRLLSVLEEQSGKYYRKKPPRESASISHGSFEVGFRESSANCEKHPDSGLTHWGTCWGCYSERHGGPRAQA